MAVAYFIQTGTKAAADALKAVVESSTATVAAAVNQGLLQAAAQSPSLAGSLAGTSADAASVVAGVAFVAASPVPVVVPKDSSASVGVGLGIGLGLTVFAAAFVGGFWWLRRHRAQAAAAAAKNGIVLQSAPVVVEGDYGLELARPSAPPLWRDSAATALGTALSPSQVLDALAAAGCSITAEAHPAQSAKAAVRAARKRASLLLAPGSAYRIASPAAPSSALITACGDVADAAPGCGNGASFVESAGSGADKAAASMPVIMVTTADGQSVPLTSAIAAALSKALTTAHSGTNASASAASSAAAASGHTDRIASESVKDSSQARGQTDSRIDADDGRGTAAATGSWTAASPPSTSASGAGATASSSAGRGFGVFGWSLLPKSGALSRARAAMPVLPDMASPAGRGASAGAGTVLIASPATGSRVAAGSKTPQVGASSSRNKPRTIVFGDEADPEPVPVVPAVPRPPRQMPAPPPLRRRDDEDSDRDDAGNATFIGAATITTAAPAAAITAAESEVVIEADLHVGDAGDSEAAVTEADAGADSGADAEPDGMEDGEHGERERSSKASAAAHAASDAVNDEDDGLDLR